MIETTDIHMHFDSKTKLYAAYMPYVKNGGIFYKTNELLPMGAKLKLKIQLPEESESHELDGIVVWITPKGAQSNKPAGMGIQFQGSDARFLVNKIETHLAGLLKSAQLTDTM